MSGDGRQWKDGRPLLVQSAPAEDATLDELQAWMVALIGHDKSLTGDPLLSKAAAVHFSGNARLSPAEQIDIYRVQYWLRHTAVLIDHFDGLSRYLGQQRWQTLAEGFLRRTESSVVALSDLGHDLWRYIEQLAPFSDQRLCADMARLEWAYQRAFSAADDDLLSLEKIEQIPLESWAQARFSVSHSLQFLELSYPVADLRRKLRAGDRLEQNALSQPRSHMLVVYRRDQVIYDKELSGPAFLLLRELAQNTPLIPACERVIERCPEAQELFENQLMQWFSLWGKLGWITDVAPG